MFGCESTWQVHGANKRSGGVRCEMWMVGLFGVDDRGGQEIGGGQWRG